MTLDTSLAGRHALVCGASAGIGRAAALALAGLGARVTALARSAERLEALAADLRAAGAPEAWALAADLDDRPALERAVAEHLERRGPAHVLVNNTGGPRPGPLLEAGEAALVEAFGRHVLAAHLLVRLVLPGMRAAGYGRIVNVVSTSVREPIPNLGVSNTVRAAVAAWAKTLSRELPPGVTINTVLPGYTDTERLASLAEGAAARTGKAVEDVRAGWLATIPEGRLGRPEELGAVIAFLASPAAAYVRGVALPVDGGRLNGI
ncbi:MAG: SDR family oxidoreductase [Planctomycetes bacterium]|nr:SDR family oxidoreductase [Planctomycetota bacterium]